MIKFFIVIIDLQIQPKICEIRHINILTSGKFSECFIFSKYCIYRQAYLFPACHWFQYQFLNFILLGRIQQYSLVFFNQIQAIFICPVYVLLLCMFLYLYPCLAYVFPSVGFSNYRNFSQCEIYLLFEHALHEDSSFVQISGIVSGTQYVLNQLRDQNYNKTLL